MNTALGLRGLGWAVSHLPPRIQDERCDICHARVFERATLRTLSIVCGAILVEFDVGTFADVLALFDKDAYGDRFATTSSISDGAILAEKVLYGLPHIGELDGGMGEVGAHHTQPTFYPVKGLLLRPRQHGESIEGSGKMEYPKVPMESF